MMSFQKIYGLYGLEHHTVEINGDVTMRTDGRTNEQTSENRATQSLDSVRVRLSFAIKICFLPPPLPITVRILADPYVIL